MLIILNNIFSFSAYTIFITWKIKFITSWNFLVNMYRVDIAEVVVVVELLGGPWQPRLPTKSEDEIIEPFLTFVKKVTKF